MKRQERWDSVEIGDVQNITFDLRVFGFLLYAWTMKMEPRGCFETSIRNYQYSLRNNPEQRSFHHVWLINPELSTVFSTYQLIKQNRYKIWRSCYNMPRRHKGGRCIALHFFNIGARWGACFTPCHVPPALLTGTKSGVHYAGRWVLFATTLNGRWIFLFHSLPNSRHSSLQRIAIGPR